MMMEMTNNGIQIRRNYKDTLFREIFKEKKALLSLYNAVNDSNYTDLEEFQITTLENAIYMNIKNDVSFILGNYINLYEHQSTINPNMPLRNLQYLSKQLEGMIDYKKLYSPQLVKIPTPRFIVFYNGVGEYPEKMVIRLSDSYKNTEVFPELELSVTVFNINYGENKAIMKKCSLLYEYSIFVDKIRSYTKLMAIDQAVERAVEESINEGILKEFLIKNRAEAIRMSIFEYNEEEVMEMLREDYKQMGLEEGREEGKKEGIKEGIKENKLSIIKNHSELSIPILAKILDLEENVVETAVMRMKNKTIHSDEELMDILFK